jgi:hypothetical protein
MEELEKTLIDMVNHIEEHQEVYKTWSNEQIVKTWMHSHHHIFKKFIA